MRSARGLWVLALAIAPFIGCSNDTVTPTNTTPSTLIQGQIGQSDFQITVDHAGTPNRPFEGPFILRGSNLHYDDALHALVVDLTVRNQSRSTYPEPIGLTFVQLSPDSVTVLNPDNGVHGAGAAITFHFQNSDGVWTPGETSLPRTVQFGVDPGVAIAFVARLDIGTPPTTGSGTIAGRVWNDKNKDGVMDPDEPGLPGMRVTLQIVDGTVPPNAPPLMATLTDPDGNYAFHNLRAGVYEVSKAPSLMFMPTTPTSIHVLLSPTDTGVSSYLDANFGCVAQMTPPPFPIGSVVDVSGAFVPDNHDMENATINAIACSDSSGATVVDTTVDDPCTGGRLRGPVTAVAPDRHVVVVMGTPVHFDTFPADIQVGDRVDLLVARARDIGWVAIKMTSWTQDGEQVRGHVEDVRLDPARGILIRVVGVWVLVGMTTAG